MMQSYDDLSRFMVFGIQPVERVQALPADYCEFRLCMTPADSGGVKGIGLCPYPYQLFTKGVFQ